MSEKYFGFFEGYDDVREQFFNINNPQRKEDEFPDEEQILWASYNQEWYEGEAMVLFESGDQLYLVRGSHCSCYGLEEQWCPEETDWEHLKFMVKDSEPDKYTAFWSGPGQFELYALIAKNTFVFR